MKMIKFRLIVFLLLMLIVINLSSSTQARWVSMDELNLAPEILQPSDRQEGAARVVMYQNNPHVVYLYGGDVIYMQWSGSQWTKADGTPGFDNLQAGFSPDLQLDSDGNPRIVLNNASTNAIYTQWTPSACGGSGCWTQADGITSLPSFDILGTAGALLKLFVDEANNAHVVWRKQINDHQHEPLYTRWTPGMGWTWADRNTLGAEQVTNLNSGGVGFNFFIYQQNPMFVVNEGGMGIDIYFSKWTSSACGGSGCWTKADGLTSGLENISNTPANYSNSPRIYVDDQGNIKIFWNEVLNTGYYDILYTQYTQARNQWTRADGLTSGYENITNTAGTSGMGDYYHPSFAYDPNGNLNLAWVDYTSGNYEIYFTRFVSGIGWTKADKTTVGYDNVSNTVAPSTGMMLVLDSINQPMITWYGGDSGSREIYYTRWMPSVGWTKADKTTLGVDNVSNTVGDSYVDSIVIDSVNLPYIFWIDNTNGTDDLYFAKWGLSQESDVNITASVDPNLTLTVNPSYCNFETFDINTIKTCNYNAIVTTNAVNGYTAFVKATGDMLNQSDPTYNLANTTSGIGPNADKIDIGYEEYGIATSDTDTVAVTAKVADCAGENNSVEPVSAVSLSSSDLSFATSAGPIADDSTTLCHVAAISGATVAGNYNQNIVITVVGNF